MIFTSTIQRSSTRRLIAICLILVLGILSSCGDREKETSGKSSEAGGSGTVVVRNFDRTLRFKTTPDRIVTLNQSATELFLALGLEDRLVGTAYLDNEVLPRFKKEFENIPVLAEQYPSLEILLRAEPDFVYGFQSAFSPPKGPATVDRLKKLGITAYVDRMFYDSGLTIEDVYQEILKLGRIFRVENRAKKLVSRLKEKVNRSLTNIPDISDTIPVAVYDSGRETFYTAGNTVLTDMIQRVGGTNVFSGDLDKSWGSMSWEQLVREDPEYIVILDYNKPTADEKVAFLKNKEGLQSVRAIEQENFVVVPLTSTFIGIRFPDAIRRLVDGLYGEKPRNS